MPWWDKVISAMGGNLLDGVKDIIQTFKLPPEQQLAFDSKMAELKAGYETKLAELAVEDRNSARQREMAIKDKTVSNLAYIIVGSFVAVGAFMIVHPYFFPGLEIEPEMLTLIGTIVGYLAAKAEQVASYYFGSSAGQDHMMKQHG